MELTDSVALEDALIKMRTKGKYDLKAYKSVEDMVSLGTIDAKSANLSA